ncbi:hypothetical protein AQPE_1678 [Aquipluma nitroreducens]|uniref:TonB-dependent receptor n=1 Tax=Aquipluma nitroreducens TaxID=2010828 RepID=A0A5K7S7Q6_9BACT|nr:hypothetical protein AQPE_1678 [Aquipluma nitroreducens]
MVLICWCEILQAQPKIGVNEASQLVEKVALFTDRETYVVNEDILFSAFNVSSPALRSTDWSHILYVELIAPNGEAFARKKYEFSQDGTASKLRIPSSVLTGNYYLRAYTRWMRDYSPYNYFYKMITVINPFRGELLEPQGTSDHETATVIAGNSANFNIKTNKKIYQKRDQVSLDISGTSVANSADKLVVSVIPKGTENQLIPKLTAPTDQKFSPDFIPETRGLSISGKVVNVADSVPMPFTLVGLTIFKENPENQNVLTNEKGQFFFDLSKLKGEYEIFISAKSNENPLILVDNDFSTQKIELPYVPVNLSEKSKKLYQSLAFNSQMQTLYMQKKVESEVKSFSSDSSFYGKPDFVLRLDKYIAMPSVRDYIYELMPQLGIRHEGKKTTLKILGVYSDLAIHDPLVLVDMVPVFDIDRVLELQPDKIERIELVTIPYVRGDIVFGGIVSFFSKKGDLAGIDLPSVGRFITYDMLSRNLVQKDIDAQNQRIPDLRNCLYWNPDLKLRGTESAKISFNTGDCAGDFLIVVRGIDREGKVKIATEAIMVE